MDVAVIYFAFYVTLHSLLLRYVQQQKRHWHKAGLSETYILNIHELQKLKIEHSIQHFHCEENPGGNNNDAR